ncbi:hypothetical protein, partial [Novosphingobium sp. AAP93]|uniref:hypothetical protein n=1 Tax=Novosphingobium sp. AAP93 TaxID=1523427 RepID=UPI000A93DC06
PSLGQTLHQIEGANGGQVISQPLNPGSDNGVVCTDAAAAGYTGIANVGVDGSFRVPRLDKFPIYDPPIGDGGVVVNFLYDGVATLGIGALPGLFEGGLARLGLGFIDSVATTGSRATLDAVSRSNLYAAVQQTGSLSEAKGLVYAQREGLRLGYDKVLPSLTYRGNQGIDLALQSSATRRYAIWEAKGGMSQTSLSALSTDTLGITQGSARFIDTRLQRYIDFGNGAHGNVAFDLQNARLTRNLDSFTSFYGSRRTYQLPLTGAGIHPATIVP